MSTNAVRIVVQLVLAGPVLLLLPMTLVVSGAAIFSIAGGDSSGMVLAVIVLLAAFPFSALLASIVLPLATLCRRRWLLWLVRISLGLGILMAILLLLTIPGHDQGMGDTLQFAWAALGSLVVASWNLYRMQVYQPVPTPTVEAAD